MDWRETNEIQHGQALGLRQSQVWTQTGKRNHGEQLCGEGFWGSGGWKAWHELVLWAWSPKGQSILVCIKIGVASVVKEVTDPILCCSCEVLAAVLYPDLGTAAQERCGAFGFFQRRATRIIKGLKYLSFEEKLRQLGLFILEKWSSSETSLHPSSTWRSS